MSEKPLLLSSAKSGVIFEAPPTSSRWRVVATLIGLFVIMVGAVDAASRVGRLFSGIDVAQTAFAPIGTLDFSKKKVETVSTAPLTPARISIPSLKVNAKIEPVTVKSDGKTMAAPSNYANVAWYEPGAKPGGEGNAVFAGHLNSPILSRVGVFEHLADIKLGDLVTVSDAAEKKLTYVVSEMNEYTTALAPVASIFSSTGPSQIVLVTCEGDWDPVKRTFEKRLVIVARLLPS